MISRTLVFSTTGKLSVRYGQLVWSSGCEQERTFPIEDIGVVVLESSHIEVSAAVFRVLVENNVAVIVCNESHMPTAQLLPYTSHTTAAETICAQLKATEAVQGRLWKQICKQKILNQAALANRLGKDIGRRLSTLANQTKNGDPANCEAQAARIYFQTIGPTGFLREREGDWPNPALNYGYAILRAAVARGLVGSGLVCFRGIHHHNKYNAFALADDIMEPYRPFVDQYVFCKTGIFAAPTEQLTKEMRIKMLEVLTCDVKLSGLKRPLQIAISYTAASLARYYKKEADALVLPELC